MGIEARSACACLLRCVVLLYYMSRGTDSIMPTADYV